jgi:hypothetical protein
MIGHPEPQPCGWCLFSDPWELLPNDDICPHINGMECRCQPELNDDETIVHNAFDHREDFIEGKRRPS